MVRMNWGHCYALIVMMRMRVRMRMRTRMRKMTTLGKKSISQMYFGIRLRRVAQQDEAGSDEDAQQDEAASEEMRQAAKRLHN